MLKFLTSNKGLLFIAFGNLVGAVITGSFWLFLATIQTPEGYGKTNYIFSVGSLASFIALLGLNTTVTTFLAKGVKDIAVQANQITLISAAIIGLVVGTMVGWIAGLFVLTMTFWMMSSYSLLGNKKYREYALVIIGARALQLILSFVLYFLFGSWGVIIGFIISFAVFSYRYFGSIRNFNFRFAEIKNKFRFSLHAYTFNMSTAFLMYFDKLIIFPLFGYTVLGYYQISLQFLLFIGMVPISLFQYLLSEESSGNMKSKLRLAGFGISSVLAILLFILGPWLIQTFFPNFMDSVNAVRIMSIGIIPMTIVWITNSRLFSMGKSRIVALGSGIYLSIQIVLIYFLGKQLGVIGLALALVIALVCQSLFLYFSKKY